MITRTKRMFLVEVVSWRHDDKFNQIIFVTKNKKIAASWTARFNRLIEGQTQKIREGGWMEKCPHNEPTPFWFDYITDESPRAYSRGVDVR